MAINREFWIKQAEHCEREARILVGYGKYDAAAIYEKTARMVREYAKDYPEVHHPSDGSAPPVDMNQDFTERS